MLVWVTHKVPAFFIISKWRKTHFNVKNYIVGLLELSFVLENTTVFLCFRTFKDLVVQIIFPIYTILKCWENASI